MRNLVAAEEKLHKDLRETVDRKFEERRDTLATKDEIRTLELKMEQWFGAMEVLIERNTNRLLIWLVSSIVATAGLFLPIAKLVWD